MNGQRRLWFAISVSFLVTATFVLMLLIIIMCGTELSAQESWLFFSPSTTKNILQSKLLRCSVDLSSTSAGLFFITDRPKCILVSLVSFGMFALKSYLVLLPFRFRGYHKKRGVRRCRVSSCLWTRRKNFLATKRAIKNCVCISCSGELHQS